MTRRSANAPRPAPRTSVAAADPHRAYALRVASEGFSLLTHAVNACDNPATLYRFAEAEREQFLTLCAKLYALIESGTIEPRSLAIAPGRSGFPALRHPNPAAPNGVAHGPGLAGPPSPPARAPQLLDLLELCKTHIPGVIVKHALQLVSFLALALFAGPALAAEAAPGFWVGYLDGFLSLLKLLASPILDVTPVTG